MSESVTWEVDGLLMNTEMLVVSDYDVLRCSPAYEALLQWLRFHGVDPHEVLASSGVVIRRPGECRVLYVGALRDAGGHLVFPVRRRVHHVQGETPPLPWPPALQPAKEEMEV